MISKALIKAEDVLKLWKWVSAETPSLKMKEGKSLLQIAAENGHDFHNLDHFFSWLQTLDAEQLTKLYDDIAYGGRRKYWKDL